MVSFDFLFSQDHGYNESDLNKVLKSSIFLSITKCPFCNSPGIIKNGKTKSKKQRYICSSCRKSCSETTGSPVMYSKKPLEVWAKYLFYMSKNYTLREISHCLNINLSTSFYWRHKILSVIGSAFKNNKLSNTIEINELRLTENFKGNRKIKPQIINKRNYVMILSCLDSDENKLLRASAMNKIGRLERVDLDKHLAPSIEGGKIIVVPRNDKYINFAKVNNMQISMVGSHNYSLPGFDDKRSNTQSRLFKAFLTPFSGVASKYISYYINWFTIIDEKDTLSFEKLFNNFILGKRQLKIYEFIKVQFDGSLAAEY